MKFTFWDQLVLNITGRLPKKTQAEVDALVETKAMIARVIEVEAKAREEAIKKRSAKKVAFKEGAVDGDGDGLIQDGTIHERKAPAKKKPTPRKKKS